MNPQPVSSDIAGIIERLQGTEALDWEIKAARGGLPNSIWETIIAFANTAVRESVVSSTIDLGLSTTDSAVSTIDSASAMVDSAVTARDTSSGHKDTSSGHKDEMWDRLEEIAAPVSRAKRTPPEQLQDAVLQLCQVAPLTRADLAKLLNRSPKTVNRITATLLRDGRLSYEQVSRTSPHQRYITSMPPTNHGDN